MDGNGQEVMTVADWIPTVDISETETEYAIQAELPGVKKQDVKVTMQNGALTIQGDGGRGRLRPGASIIGLKRRMADLRGASHFPTRSRRATCGQSMRMASCISIFPNQRKRSLGRST